MLTRLLRAWHRKNKRMNERKNTGRVEGTSERGSGEIRSCHTSLCQEVALEEHLLSSQLTLIDPIEDGFGLAYLSGEMAEGQA